MTLATGKSISSGTTSVSWYQARDYAPFKTTDVNGFSTIMSMKTTNGDWSIGHYTHSSYVNQMLFSYVADSDRFSNNRAYTCYLTAGQTGNIITSSNIGSQSVNYATSAGSVAWSNVSSKPGASGNATTPVYWNGSGFTNCTAYGSASVNYANYSAYLPPKYDGGQKTNPQTYFNFNIGLRVAMTGSWSVWSDTLWINGYSGSDVRNMCALHFLRNGTPRMAITTQRADATSYGTYYEFLSTYNYTSYCLPRSAGSSYPLTGLLYINTNGNNAYIGSANSSWFHFQNGVSINFYFSNSVYANGQFYLYSDRHKKNNIKTIDKRSLDDLFDISDKLLKQFKYKSSKKQSYGFIAQEIEKYIPEAVSEGPDAKTVCNDVAYAKILAAIIQRIKKIEKSIQSS